MEAMIFESHAHYDDEQFEEDRTELLNSMQENGIGTIINVGATFQSCTEVVQLAQEYPFIYAAVGVHPDEVGILDEEKFAYLREQCKRDKVVAVGEIGLDYYWDNESHEIQKKWFQRQLELAREFNLPVIIHSRDAAADTLEMMQQHAKGLRGVIHCFSGSAEMAKEYVKMGYYIGVGGVVTFKNSRVLKEVVKAIPLECIVVETDCPYLAPAPHRGKRNSSAYLPLVIEEIARLKEITAEEVENVTYENAQRLYGLIH